jgi:hypothetical protein
MLNIAPIFKEFEIGGIERIFVCFYSYFIIGYIILFSIYENSFVNLEFTTQIILAIAISFPITTISVSLLHKEKIKQDSSEGFFYAYTTEFILVSYYYSILFILFYIVKHLEIINYDTKLDPVIGLIIFLFFYILVELIYRYYSRTN